MLGKTLRFIGILLLGITVAFQILGAIGSSCVALGAEKYDSMAALAPVKGLYQLLILITLAAAIYGVRVTLALARGRANAYKAALIVLLVTLLTSGIQMITSQVLRGASAPTNVRVYTTLITLLVFLLFKLPGVWEKVQFERSEGAANRPGAGMTLFLAGVMVLTVPVWAGPSHLINGVNYAGVWQAWLTWVGWGLAVGGAALLLQTVFELRLPVFIRRSQRLSV